MVCVK